MTARFRVTTYPHGRVAAEDVRRQTTCLKKKENRPCRGEAVKQYRLYCPFRTAPMETDKRFLYDFNDRNSMDIMTFSTCSNPKTVYMYCFWFCFFVVIAFVHVVRSFLWWSYDDNEYLYENTKKYKHNVRRFYKLTNY